MLFADDSYVYCKENTEEVDNVKKLLDMFENATGQKVNCGKSSIFFSSNTAVSHRTELCSKLQIQESGEKTTYLGLPTRMGRNKSSLLGYLKERIDNRMQSWDEGFISRLGKEVLIKNVAHALPSYAMSVFLLPQGITKDMERMLARYWWKSKPKQNSGITWMSWEGLSKHKSTGGMGFRDFYDFNLAMLAKQGWRFLSKPDSMVSRVFKARYFPNKNFMAAILGHNPSFVWRSIWESIPLLKSGVRWIIGPGDKIDIKHQPWLNIDDPYVTTESLSFEQNKVASLMRTGCHQWDTDIIKDLFNARDQQSILNTKIDSTATEDRVYWSKEVDEEYSIRSAYRLLQLQKGRWSTNDNDNLWRKMWQVKAPPKVLNLIWRALSYCLPTMVMLDQKRVPVIKTCPVCNGEDETIFHALVTCPFAHQCWEKARNDKYWNNKQVSLNGLLAPEKLYLSQWQEAQCRSKEALIHRDSSRDGVNSWAAPQMVTIKVNVDAAIFKDPSAYSIGLIARDSSGQLVHAHSSYYRGEISPENAKVLAIKEALSWLKQQQWEEVQPESDCLVAVQAINSKVCMISPFGSVVEECSSLIRNLNKIILSFVRRSANMAAHFLAKESCSYPGRVISRSDVPTGLKNVMLNDLK
ncbi:hypothetical protein AgCh_017395 [Apium graveolens]